ncbi:hypothetical protein Syun_025292 [Stephania yunnanensis]|uniref:RNase H type-1 domain-containing protein n=1 Tax=Stephania yunnanensis TaxID=152371 RepID=A0AAP0HUR9_9MAGN
MGPKGDPGNSSFGGSFHDSNGSWLLGYIGNISFSTNVITELWAIQEGLHLAKQCNYQLIILESDSIFALTFLQINDPESHTAAALLLDYKELLQSLKVVQLQHVFREANQVTEALANSASNRNAFLNGLFLSLISPFSTTKDLEIILVSPISHVFRAEVEKSRRISPHTHIDEKVSTISWLRHFTVGIEGGEGVDELLIYKALHSWVLCASSQLVLKRGKKIIHGLIIGELNLGLLNDVFSHGPVRWTVPILN